MKQRTLRSKKRLFILLLVATLFATMLFDIFRVKNTTIVHGYEGQLSLAQMHQVDQAILQYVDAHRQEVDFEFERVKVVVKHLTSIGNHKENTLAEINRALESIGIESIEGWISPEEINENPLWNKDKFQQILDVRLKPSKNGKEQVMKAVEELSKLDVVLSASPVYIYDVVDKWTPTDTHFAVNQINLKKIEMEKAWNLARGGTNVTVGIMESGTIENHEDLRDGNNVSRISMGNHTASATAHATNVGGIVAAVQNSIGIAGIAQVNLCSLISTSSSFDASLTWAANNDVWVINASFIYEYGNGSYAPFNPTHAAALSRYNGLFIACAGNEERNNDAAQPFPSSYYYMKNVISVGATTNDDVKYSYSNYGSKSVSLYAPGNEIWSTDLNNTYTYKKIMELHFQRHM